ncbi:MAG TPA: BBE domain-containing protein [Candidatus Binatia bacterium]|nr:BBE domain-containing protein [Candidatus Binatia bacterium]
MPDGPAGRGSQPKATGVYANFLEDEGDARIRAAYPAGAYERLIEIKRRYDPANLLHRNQNIRPG